MLKAIFKFVGINQRGSDPGSTLKWSNGDSAVYPLNPIPNLQTFIKPYHEREMKHYISQQINFQTQLLIIGDKS